MNVHEQLQAYMGEDAYSFDGVFGPSRSDREDCAPKAFTALQTILEIHEPFTLPNSGHVGCDHCSHVPVFVDYPCPTVAALVTALEAP